MTDLKTHYFCSQLCPWSLRIRVVYPMPFAPCFLLAHSGDVVLLKIPWAPLQLECPDRCKQDYVQEGQPERSSPKSSSGLDRNLTV